MNETKQYEFLDDFKTGLDIGKAESKWACLGFGSVTPDDGIVTTTENGIEVVSKGINKVTNEPAFTFTIGRDKVSEGIPAILDHIKWQANVNHRSASGVPGFDVIPGKTIEIEAVMSAQTYGTAMHPFGQYVKEPESDFRLASATLLTVDPQSNIVFDFFLTNDTIYAFYERTPAVRHLLGNYSAFSYAFPVGKRKSEDFHRLKISYCQDTNTARWYVDEMEVLCVENVGKRMGREGLFLDAGGEEETVLVKQINCGLALFTILDGSFDGNPALVNLSGKPDYFNTAEGEPVALTFIDDDSKESNRLFGQGAGLKCKKFTVTYK